MDPLSIFDTFPTVGNATGTTEIFNHKGFFCRGGLLTHWGLESVGESFWTTWVAFTILGLVTVFSTSGPLFYYYYWPGQVTFEKWQYKSNPKFPSPEKVRDEIVQMCKCTLCATLCPAAAVWLTYRGLGDGFCGTPEGYSWKYHVAMFGVVMIVSDFYEFFYHWCAAACLLPRGINVYSLHNPFATLR